MAVIERVPSLPQDLEQMARGLRPNEKSFVPVLDIAERLGVQVRLCFNQSSNLPPVILLNDKPPRIRLTRKAPVTGYRVLSGHDEHLLTPRERFSIAHELGHFLAYQHFQILPAQNRSEYWVHETWMHSFAGALLTSENTLQQCLHRVADGEPISPFVLRSAALKGARLSQEVVATQLCKRRSEIGFMKVLIVQNKRKNRPVLAVAFAVSGTRLFLPRNYAHIEHQTLLDKLQQNEYGQLSLRACTLGKVPAQNLRIAWLRTGNMVQQDRSNNVAESVPAFWVSVALHALRNQPQLNFW